MRLTSEAERCSDGGVEFERRISLKCCFLVSKRLRTVYVARSDGSGVQNTIPKVVEEMAVGRMWL